MKMYKLHSQQGPDGDGDKKVFIAEIDAHRPWLEVSLQLVLLRQIGGSSRGLSSAYRWRGRSFEVKCPEYYKDLLGVITFLEKRGYHAQAGRERKPASGIKYDKQLTEERFPLARSQKICVDLQRKNAELKAQIEKNEQEILKAMRGNSK